MSITCTPCSCSFPVESAHDLLTTVFIYTSLCKLDKCTCCRKRLANNELINTTHNSFLELINTTHNSFLARFSWAFEHFETPNNNCKVRQNTTSTPMVWITAITGYAFWALFFRHQKLSQTFFTWVICNKGGRIQRALAHCWMVRTLLGIKAGD